ncbi:MAG: hypothetical protein EB084_02875, partial [Proteobacteria bacterium]|nr:hypothetical protein [Pseudomonadota bacterium]
MGALASLLTAQPQRLLLQQTAALSRAPLNAFGLSVGTFADGVYVHHDTVGDKPMSTTTLWGTTMLSCAD